MKHIYLTVLLFITALTQAQIDFENHLILDVTTSTSYTLSSQSVDIDGDGDLDVISASSDNKIAWNENEDGQGLFSNLKIISNEMIDPYSVYAADMDGDGDMDVLSASFNDNKIAWFENLDGLGNFGLQNNISSSATEARQVYAEDFDNDGDMDVLSGYWGHIVWYENLDGLGNFSDEYVISNDVNLVFSLTSTDIDSDGDMDILSTSWSGNISWFENINGLGDFSDEIIIESEPSTAFYAFPSDIDGDGDMDIITGRPGHIAWYENTDGQGNFVFQQMITTDVYRPRSIYTFDADLDGDLDIITASSDVNGNFSKVAWHENLDGQGNYGNQIILSTFLHDPRSIHTNDIDNDGYTDILISSAKDGTVSWIKNLDGTGNFSDPNPIATETQSPRWSYSADFDGDGDMDVVSISWGYGNIIWFKNIDGQGDFRIAQVISNTADFSKSIYAEDFDGDGDLDLIVAIMDADTIAWYENTDGLGKFGPEQIISTNADRAWSVYAGDFDGDGDIDALSASFWDGKIAWYENIDGIGSFSSEIILSSGMSPYKSVMAIDIDNDGDLDVITASDGSSSDVQWFENLDGQGNFSETKIIADDACNPESVFAADMDGDGDMDVLSAGCELIWFENLDGQGNFDTEHIITTEIIDGKSVYVVDMDNDGDMDVLSASNDDNKIAWYENIDGQGNFNSQQIITTNAMGAESVFATDLDNDGDIDVISTSYFDDKLMWYENLIVLGLNENSSLDFSIYPVPTSSILTINTQNNVTDIIIYNLLGEYILSNTNQNSIDIGVLNQGVYFVKIKDVNGNVGVKKIIKD